MGGRPGLGEGACSAGAGGAGVRAGSGRSGQVVLNPGLGLERRVD